MTCGGSHDTYVSATDNNEPIRKYFTVESMGTFEEGETFQNHMEKMIGCYQTNPICSEVGMNCLDYQEDDLTYRFTFNITKTYNNGLILKGYITYVQNKDSKELYRFQYSEQAGYYDDTRAMTVIYSCLPVTQK